jgi:phosphoribosylformimino-5-aminoimidazole carboxamide ribotide isomerase
MQIGGGITDKNAEYWIDNGASSVILTSWLIENSALSYSRIKHIANLIGRNKTVIDLSCKKKSDGYYITSNKWQTITNEKITPELLEKLSEYTHEFLIHAVDVEGTCSGADKELISFLAEHSPITCVYAGGINSYKDINLIENAPGGKLHYTVGSALDIFGGNEINYKELLLRK